jgi:NAD(P)-dependent dehydrogenase (short-subunit alcohol dehydrogenase family)
VRIESARLTAPTDLAYAEVAQRLVAVAQERYGRLDVRVNEAG